MIPNSLEFEQKRENEATTGGHAELEAGTLNSLQKLGVLPPVRLIQYPEWDDNGNKLFCQIHIALYCTIGRLTMTSTPFTL